MGIYYTVHHSRHLFLPSQTDRQHSVVSFVSHKTRIILYIFFHTFLFAYISYTSFHAMHVNLTPLSFYSYVIQSISTLLVNFWIAHKSWLKNNGDSSITSGQPEFLGAGLLACCHDILLLLWKSRNMPRVIPSTIRPLEWVVGPERTARQRKIECPGNAFLGQAGPNETAASFSHASPPPNLQSAIIWEK